MINNAGGNFLKRKFPPAPPSKNFIKIYLGNNFILIQVGFLQNAFVFFTFRLNGLLLVSGQNFASQRGNSGGFLGKL